MADTTERREKVDKYILFFQLAMTERRYMTARFWDKVNKTDHCWLWTGAKNRNGYGNTSIRYKNKSICLLVHRVAWILTYGIESFDSYLQIDHLCKTVACLNPAHLEMVTGRENNRRSNSTSAINATKTHCKYGHEFTPNNTHIIEGGRSCVACEKAYRRRYKSIPANKTKLNEQERRWRKTVWENRKSIVITCACGCGGTKPMYDRGGRVTRFIRGHNNHAGVSRQGR